MSANLNNDNVNETHLNHNMTYLSDKNGSLATAITSHNGCSTVVLQGRGCCSPNSQNQDWFDQQPTWPQWRGIWESQCSGRWFHFLDRGWRQARNPSTQSPLLESHSWGWWCVYWWSTVPDFWPVIVIAWDFVKFMFEVFLVFRIRNTKEHSGTHGRHQKRQRMLRDTWKDKKTNNQIRKLGR